MDDPILFNPDNRLLGGATGDLSLYGGQSGPKFSIHQARDDAPSAQEPSGDAVPGAVPAAAPADEPAARLSPDDSPEPVIHGAGASTPAAFLITSPGSSFEPLASATPAVSPIGTATGISDWNPASHGAGSTIPVLDKVAAADAIEVADATPGIVTGTATAMLDDLAATGPSIAMAVPPIADTAGAALHATVGAVEDTLGAVEDMLDGLAGSDPLGGVATLVSLVSVSDMFDLNPGDAPVIDAAGDPGLGVLDTLAGEETLPDTLLGTHHDDGLLGGHLDHPLGL
jgi:hypothetical protein